MRRFLFLAHRWLGLASVVLLLVSGLTGSLLVFRSELEPPASPPAVASMPLHYQALADAVSERYPQQRFSLRFGTTPEQMVQARVKTASGLRHLWLDPTTAVVVRDCGTLQCGWNLIFALHESLLLGDAAQWLSGSAGIVLVLLSVSGVLIWWPRKQGRRWCLHAATHLSGRIANLHRQTGICLALVLLIAGLSGSLLVFSKPVHRWVNQLAGVAPLPPLRLVNNGLPYLPLDVLVAQADRALPGGRLVDIRIEHQTGQPWVVRKRLPGEVHPNGRSQIELDPVSGAVLRVTPASQAAPAMTLNAWVYALHIGAVGGVLHRSLLLLAGLGLTWLCISGAWQWGLRRLKRVQR